MKQEQFVERYAAEWAAMEQWLQRRGHGPRRDKAASASLFDDAQFPARYRRLCQHLAVARERGYSLQLVMRLQRAMQQGHAVIYRAPAPRWRRALEFLLAGFPSLVRAQAGVMWASTALFALPLVGLYLLVLWQPHLVNHVLDPQALAQVEDMYDPQAAHQLNGRESDSDWRMFGHYIMNNISIGLRTFAGGLLAGLGTVLVLVYNGLTIGAVAGHLQAIGYGGPFWRFVCGHGALELTAIVIAGGAGLRLGLALVAPGRMRRRDALVQAGRIGARLSLGVATMLLLAAFVEAFWSSSHTLPGWLKYLVAAVLWILVLGWLWRGGYGRGGRAGDAA
jgi:uncharacterized membrane protein SpoIIM required for sporulation